MSETELDGLLKRMPEIAAAVNAFQSEAVQHEAFQALVASYSGRSHAPHKHGAPTPPAAPANGDTPDAARPASNGKKPRRKGEGGRRTPKLIRDLDLNPAGKKSFTEFIEEKQPKSNEDKYAVAVYYLEQIAALDAVSFDHVASVFRMTSGWKEPSNFISGITNAASRKGTIDTKDYNNVKTTPRGRNFVEHELPPKVRK